MTQFGILRCLPISPHLFALKAKDLPMEWVVQARLPLGDDPFRLVAKAAILGYNYPRVKFVSPIFHGSKIWFERPLQRGVSGYCYFSCSNLLSSAYNFR